MNIVFETDRLLLREFNSKDALLLFELNRDPEVTRYTLDHMTDPAEAFKALNESILPQYELYNYGRWAVYLKSSQAFLGWCGLKFRPDRNETDLGYRFSKRYWGQGFATEAADASLKFGFNTLQLKTIMGRSLPGNLASIRVLQKCGMLYVGEETIDGYLHKSYQADHPVIQ